MSGSIRQIFETIFGVGVGLPTVGHLEQIADRFALIPYENLSKIVRASESPTGVAVETAEGLLENYRLWGAGGTCFSLTHCLRAVARAYGYRPEVHLADLARGTNNHCALVVPLGDTRYLIDPGYLITRPLPLPESGDVLHETRLNPVRLERDPTENSYYLSTIEPDGEKPRYRLHGEVCGEDEFRRVWADSFSWPMMHSMLVTRATDSGRIYAHDRFVRIVRRDGREQFKIREQFDRVLAEQTGISVSLIRRARGILSESKRELREKEDA